ncbi:gliding motility-associated C-terminal domain-containing protein [Winogradskyella litorisediminis]|uniref:Gliding motility-associated C-terminal domain-containing protein n=1 Tax=Winogradskyella litorisediminis TaxID=1156618 RepID=A0ABW3N7T7_9FLAO
MEIYLLKSSAILVIFWLLYVFFLEKENMHRFKRIYLITSVGVAFVIPLLSITEYVYVEPLKDFDFSNANIPFTINEPLEVIETSFWTLEHIVWSIYFLGVAVFSFRFIKNLFSIVKTIKTNEKQKQSFITFVLLKSLINPHTFFNFIFLNKFKFQKNEVPEEVLLHEEVHAKQKHSLDILFIELMQIVFWFQPFIWLFKKRIKLNHEFLADQAVIEAGFKPATYQNTLLNYSSHQDYSLANAIDYSSIKKRFTVMKTQTSKQKKWALRVLLLPLLGLLFYSFSDREIVEIELENTTNLLVNGKSCDQCTLNLNDIKNLELSTSDNLEVVSFLAKISGKMTEFIQGNKLNETIKNYLSETSTPKAIQLFMIKIEGQDKSGDVLIHIKEGKQQIPTPKEIASYNIWAKNVRSKFVEYPNGAVFMPPIEEEGLVENLRIYNRMTKEQKEKAVEMPYPQLDADEVEKSISSYQQNPPTAKEIAEYNTWAKKINKQNDKAKKEKNGEYAIVKHKEVMKYKAIYDRMTKAQKNNSETWPSFPPPPPPPPPAPKVIKESKNKNDFPPPPPPPMPKQAKGKLTMGHINAYNEWMTYIKSDKANAKYMTLEIYEAYRDLYEAMTDEQKKLTEGAPPPPPPPAPKKTDKSKGGPNAEIISTSTNNDYTTRQVFLRISKSQTKPPIYKINNVVSTVEEVSVYLKKNSDADLKLIEGEKNILSFSDNTDKKMTVEELQAEYKKLFKTYIDKSKKNKIIYSLTPIKNCLEIPKSFNTKNGNTFNIKCLNKYSKNKFEVYDRWGKNIYSKENYSNNWDGTVEKTFAQKGTNKPTSGTYYYVFSSPELEESKAGYLIINAENMNVKN